MNVLTPLPELSAAPEDGYIYIEDDFLEASTCEALIQFGNHRKENFRPAKVGKGGLKKLKKSIRNDKIFWIDDWSPSPFIDVQKKLTLLQQALRREMLPIKRFESHLTFYKPGGFYVRHKDRHQLSPHRLMTAVIYLTPWKPENSGELIVYRNPEDPIAIQPIQGRLALFESHLEHEVVKTHGTRWSLTTWFRDDLSFVLGT